MEIIPAVDIMKGKCVRLVRGSPGNINVYFDDPVEAAKMWEEQGAKTLHVVDLDAALGSGDNLSIIERLLKEVSIDIEIGGGIRSIQKAEKLYSLGTSRIVLGTLVVEKPEILLELTQRIDSAKIVVALDYSGENVATHGWKEITDLNIFSLAPKLVKLGAGWILFSAIERDGMMVGPDLKNIEKMVKTVDVPVIASGGVSSIQDIENLVKTGTEAVIVGKALYEKVFTFKEVQKAISKYKSRDLKN